MYKIFTERLAIKVIMISACYIEKASINFENVWELSIQIVYDESFEIYEILPPISLL